MYFVIASFIVKKFLASRIVLRRPCSHFLNIVLMASLVLNLSAFSASRPSSIYEASRSLRKLSISVVSFSVVLPFCFYHIGCFTDYSLLQFLYYNINSGLILCFVYCRSNYFRLYYLNSYLLVCAFC